MKALLALIKKLYGSKALSKTIGTRTNVITLPNKDTKRFLTNELNIDAASDAAIEKAFEDAEKLIPDIPKMNDQEILTFTGNLRRLDNRINPPSAEIIDIGTKQPVSPTGIKQLAAERGLPEGTDPNSLMGRLLTAANKLKAETQKLQTPDTRTLRQQIENPTEAEKIFRAKEKDRLSGIFEDLVTKGPSSYDWQREGIIRTGAREILEKNLKSGKLKLTDPYEKKMIEEFRQGGVDPIEVFRREYGEGALEQLDDIADDLLPAQSYKEINDILNKNKLFDLKQLSDEAKASAKESQEYADKIMKDVREGKIKNLADEPEDFATGGRVEMASGGIAALKTLIRFLGKQSGKTGSQNLADINPKRLGYLENMLMKSDKDMLYSNRIEYLEQLSDIVKGDRRLLNKIKDLPEEAREAFYKSVNEGGNKGRLDVYKDINIDDAILDIEQMIKNLKFKDVPEDAIKRQMNAGGGVAYLMGL